MSVSEINQGAKGRNARKMTECKMKMEASRRRKKSFTATPYVEIFKGPARETRLYLVREVERNIRGFAYYGV